MKKAIIFDIDNTILYHTNRNPFNWSDLSGDTLIPAIDELIKTLYLDYAILLVTGRPDSARENTLEWLLNNDVPYSELYTKSGPEKTKAVIHKEETLKKIREEYEVVMAFEDDASCADMYVRNGVFTCMPLNYRIIKK